MGTTADITAEQHNQTRRAAKARQKHNPKRHSSDDQGYLAGLQADRRESAAVANDMQRRNRERKALSQATLVIDTRLAEGSWAHTVATMVIEEFPYAVKTAGVSRTKVAQAKVLEKLVDNKSNFSENAIHLGLAIAGSAIRKGFNA